MTMRKPEVTLTIEPTPKNKSVIQGEQKGSLIEKKEEYERVTHKKSLKFWKTKITKFWKTPS